MGYGIKHLGIARRSEAGVELRVHPTLIPHRRLIANVDGVMNAILVQADAVGPTLYYGAGAGAEPTASAVVADLVDALSGEKVLEQAEVETGFYLRLSAEDRPGVMADISRILGDQGISIEAIIQKEPEQLGTTAQVILLTRRVLERRMDDAIRAIEALDAITGPVTRIRVESLI